MELAGPDLYAVHDRGETLIVEHMGFERDGEDWLRAEQLSVVGFASRIDLLRCDGLMDDSSRYRGPETLDCAWCTRCLPHTERLHLIASF